MTPEWLVFGARAVAEKQSRWRSRTRYLCFQRADVIWSWHPLDSLRVVVLDTIGFLASESKKRLEFDMSNITNIVGRHIFHPITATQLKDRRTQLLQVRFNRLTRYAQPMDAHGDW